MDPTENQDAAPVEDATNPATAELPDAPEETLVDAMDRALADDTAPELDDEDEDARAEQTDTDDDEPGEQPKDEAKPDGEPKPKEEEKPETNAEDDAQVKELGLKGRAEERFRAMSQEIRETRPVVEALKAKGLETSDVPNLIAMAEDMHRINGVMDEAQCQPQQFGRALDTIALINSGEPANVNKAIDNLLEEVKLLSNAIGREVPGLVDPLEAAPELLDEVERGNITRKLALQQLAHQQQAKIAAAKGNQASTAKAEETAFNEGKVALDRLGQELYAADPAQYAAKEPALIALAKRIRTVAKPEQWAQLIREAYNDLPYRPEPQRPAPRRTESPVSGSRSGPGMVKTQPKDMLDSIEQALASLEP